MTKKLIGSVVQRLIQRIKPYRVHILGTEDYYVHYCWSFKEALEWAACYPSDWGRAVITTRNNHWVSERI